MKARVVVALVLIILGIVILLYEGIPYEREEGNLQLGPLEATVKTERKVALPPILGGLSLAAGVILLVLGLRKKQV
ncbi:MAG: DUF3185 domain-containing protein [Acidobacteriota bacterium]